MMVSNLVRRSFRATALAGLLVVGLTACATEYPGQYEAYETGVPIRVEMGEIVSFRPVDIHGGPTSGAGAAAGAVAGGLVGANNIGDYGKGSVAGGVIGAIAGGLLGNAIEKGVSQHRGFAYTIRMRRSGDVIEVVQPDPQPIPVGAQVEVSFGPRVRVTPVGGYAPPPAPPPGR